MSSILQTATRLLMPLLQLFAVFLLSRGHNHPGGGFVAGLVISSSLVLYLIAFGVAAARRALLVDPSMLLGIGLVIAFASGLPGLVGGRPFMSAIWTRWGSGAGAIDLGTPLIFDVGVCIAVVGVVLTIVFTLGETIVAED